MIPGALSSLPAVNSLGAARRNPVVYQCATPDPVQALIFGNGRVGGSVHTPENRIEILICRNDTWDARGDLRAMAVLEIRAGAGLFSLAKHVKQTCDPAEAVITIEVDEVKFSIVCPRHSECILVEIEDERKEVREVEVRLRGVRDDDVTEICSVTHCNGESYYAECNAKVEIDGPAMGFPDPLSGRAWGVFVDRGEAGARRCRIWCAAICLPPDGSENPLGELRATADRVLAGARQDGDSLLAEHRRWWVEYWDKSYLQLTSANGDAEYEERLWYLNHYYLGCAHGGGIPPYFTGATFLLVPEPRDWGYGYFWQNMRELYWPLFAAGHGHFAKEILRFYLEAAPLARQQTRSRFGIDAILFTEVITFWGVHPGLTRKEALEGSQTNNFSNNLEICLLMDWYRKFSGDEKFFQEECYPFIKGVMDFFLFWAKRGDDGCWHITPSNALETFVDMIDPAPDLAGLHYLLPRLVTWGREFGEAPEQIERWSEFQQNLAPLPVGRKSLCSTTWEGIHVEEWLTALIPDPEGIFLPAGGQPREQTQRTNMENPELYAVFPWGLVHLDSPEPDRRRFERTWKHRTWHLCNNGWSQDVPQLARMGWSEPAKTRSLEHAGFTQRFPNGSFTCAASPRFHGMLTAHSYLDSSGVHLTGLQEMLLQDFDGILRIAPAVSCEWSGRFRLHASSGFLVEAAFYQGQPVAARLVAERDTTLRLQNRRHIPMSVAGDCTEIADGKLFEQKCLAGEIVEVFWGEEVSGLELDAERPEFIYPGWKIRPPQASWPTGHWHDERNGHGQVGLLEDGLFPATRPLE
jgi:hypothetical protein